MSLFESVGSPEDLLRIPPDRLPDLADEMREELIETIAKTGGHLGSGLGVLELTIALHYVFDFRRDRLVFDVGHQCYPHKMLTGRKERLNTVRGDDGLCGFPHPQESEYDLFHTGHAGTSVSLGLGLALADKKAGEDRRTVVVIGDAGYGAGVAFEAMNAAADLDVDLTVILNDNEMSISPTIGAMSRYFTRIRTGPLVTGAKKELGELIKHIPLIGKKLDRSVHEAAQVVRSTMFPGHVFEEFGFTYMGPMDGHDAPRMVHTLRDLKERPGLTLLHVITKKGAGCELAAADPQKLHGLKPGTIKIPPQQAGSEAEAPPGEPLPKRPPFTKIFAEALVDLAKQDSAIVGITAAMPDGTGLSLLAESHPDRFFDVGICEQHAVAFSGGLSKGGLKPVCAIYSTFLQRGYDMVFQELLIQGANAVLAMDRAGLVDDGATHHGLFDIAYLRTMPGSICLAPADGEELKAMLAWAVDEPGVVAIRYPRDSVPEAVGSVAPIEKGRAVTLREGRDVALVAYGAMVPLAMEAADLLAVEGIDCTVINGRFAKPIDTQAIGEAASRVQLLVTLEEHSVLGGFGAAVSEALLAEGMVLPRCLLVGVPDRFIEHGTRQRLLEHVGFTGPALAERVRVALESAVSDPLPLS
ncbi:MAG: 1-deoxy-D-xylulose-5-phosphate synthase [Planctomycetota bacterium]|nr:1-deoxy-D-xylulose-5-phosphate synthase [Planctomycetota bacterium]